MTAKAVIVRSASMYEGKQGPTYAGGVSAGSTGSQHLWLGRVTIPPGGRTKAHIHEHHDTAILQLDGQIDLYTGDGLGQRDVLRAGEYVFIPANCPHVAINRGATPVTAVIARTDPNEQESVVLLPELESKVPA